jgi:hypothetical protein
MISKEEAKKAEELLAQYKKQQAIGDNLVIDSNPDFTHVIEGCAAYLDELRTQGVASDHWIFEAAMQAVYGPDCWKIINQYQR